MKLLYNIYLIPALLVGVVLTIITALITIVGCALGGQRFWGYYPGKIWSQCVCALFLLPIKVEGRERLSPHTSYVFTPNHQGAFDIFLIYGYLGHNFKWLMKESLRRIPFVGRACQSAGHVFIDRVNPKKISQSMHEAEAKLTGGMSLVVFPEGSRSAGGRIGRFKKGAFIVADELQLPVVPVTISGSYEVMPKGSRWFHRHSLTLTLHDPIAPIGRGADNVRQVMSQSYEAVLSTLPARYRSKANDAGQETDASAHDAD